MKKISEMTLTELQDYALQIEGEKASLETKVGELNGNIDELTKTNLALQNRNNKLFMQLEAQSTTATDPADPAPEGEPESESCADFATKNIKEIMKR